MSDYAAYFAEKRYEIIKNVLKECVTEKEKKLTLTDALDKVFLDKYLGIPIFLILMWGVFEFAFSASAPFSDLIDMFFSRLAELASENISGLLGSFIGDGIISGLGAVLVFVPP
ncbi:MAG: ferrous iron transporter B, partial [Candidatus Hydrothermarchaeota archaeon]